MTVESNSITHLGNMPDSEETPAWLFQAAKFLSVGIINTLLDAALYFTMTRWLGFGSRQVFAKGISYGLGVLNSYYWNKNWTFKAQEGANWKLFAGFVIANLVSLAINAAAMYVCLYPLAIPEALAWVIATGAAFLWNFLISKFVIFKN